MTAVEIHRPTKAEMLSILHSSKEDTPWILDTETNGLDVIGPEAPHWAFYIGLMPLGSRHVFILTREEFDLWGIASELELKMLVGHNIRFDLHALDLDPRQPWIDTKTAAYFNHTTGRRSMDHIARLHGWAKIKTPELLKQGRILDVPEGQLFTYLADDCLITAKMAKKLRIEDAQYDYLVDQAAYGMERRGMRLLIDRLEEVRIQLKAKEDRLLQELRVEGMNGNPSSPAQIAEWLLEGGRRLPYTANGKPSTAKLVLQQLADEGDELAQLVINYRKVTKLQSGFIEPLPKLAQGGILYPRTNTTRTATGRFSCNSPNLQQIPKRGPIGKAIRGCLTSRDQVGVIACDFSQVELRVAAAFAEEGVLLDAFALGHCPHTEVAAKMLGKAPEKITPEERFNAKAVNFGILNGMGAKRLALELKRTKREARNFLDAYRRNLPSLHSWMEGVWREAETYSLAKTVAGRTRIFMGMEDTRPAISVIVQGSAAELLRHALVAVNSVGLDPIVSVHDEILVPGDKDAQLLQEVMETAAQEAYPDAFAAVKFPAEASSGETWGDV